MVTPVNLESRWFIGGLRNILYGFLQSRVGYHTVRPTLYISSGIDEGSYNWKVLKVRRGV